MQDHSTHLVSDLQTHLIDTTVQTNTSLVGYLHTRILNVPSPIKFRFLPIFTDLKEVDLFLGQLYRFWLEGGLVPSITSYILHLAALVFTFCLSWVLLLQINWTYLFHQCSGTYGDCQWTDIIRPQQPVTLIAWIARCQSQLFLIFLGFYFLLTVCLTWMNCREAFALRMFTRTALEIPSDEGLQALEWPDVVSLLLQSQEVLHSEPQYFLTALDIHHCIMRFDNYFLGIVHKKILHVHLPSWVPPRLLFTACVVWNLRLLLFSHSMNSQRQLNLSLINHPTILQRRFRLLGVLSFIFFGPVLLASGLLAIFKHAEGFRSDISRPFKRTLNGYAEWSFTDYNELPHQYKKRSHDSCIAIHHYLNLLVRDYGIICPFLRLVQYILTSLLGVLLIITLIDDGLLLHVKIGNRYLLWYSLCLGAFLTIIRSFNLQQPRNYQRENGLTLCQNLTLATIRVFQHLHTVPFVWRQLAAVSHDPGAMSPIFLGGRHGRLQTEIMRHYVSSRLIQLFDDLIAIILSPMFFFIFLPRASSDICQFIRQYSITTQRVGSICKLADFSPDYTEHFDLHEDKSVKSALHFIVSYSCHSTLPLDHQQSPNFWGYGHKGVRLLQELVDFQLIRRQEDQLYHVLKFLPDDLKEPLQLNSSFFSYNDTCSELFGFIIQSKLAWFFWFDEMIGLGHLTEPKKTLLQNKSPT